MANKDILQKNLHVIIDGEDIISKTFDFEAMCMIQDNCYKERQGQLNICNDVVYYLFEGTKATQKAIDNLPTATKAALCFKCYEIYQKIVEETAAELKNL